MNKTREEQLKAIRGKSLSDHIDEKIWELRAGDTQPYFEVTNGELIRAFIEIALQTQTDLLAIADKGEFEDMRREVERYFNEQKPCDEYRLRPANMEPVARKKLKDEY